MVTNINPTTHTQTLPASLNIDQNLIHDLKALRETVNAQFSAEEAAPFNEAADRFESHVKAAANPFSFDTDIVFKSGGAAMVLGIVIQKLLGEQPGLIASNMQISTDLVSVVSNKFSTYWLGQLTSDETAIKAATGGDQQQIATLQGQLNIDSAKSGASSAGFNGVTSAVTQGVSAKTTTYQNLVQQSNQVVTGLLSFISQIWVI